MSGSADPVNFNQELCDPIEKEFLADFGNESIMDASLSIFLRNAETTVTKLCADLDKGIISGFVGHGLLKDRVLTIVNTANRSCSTVLKFSFRAMKEVATVRGSIERVQ